MSKTYLNRTYRYAHFDAAAAAGCSYNTDRGPFRSRAHTESSVPLLVGMSSLVTALVATVIAVFLTLTTGPTAASAACAGRLGSAVTCVR